MCVIFFFFKDAWEYQPQLEYKERTFRGSSLGLSFRKKGFRGSLKTTN